MNTYCSCGSATTYCVDHCKDACAASHTNKAGCEELLDAIEVGGKVSIEIARSQFEDCNLRI